MKKITKSFFTSFLLSMSAIYVADTMFLLPSMPAKKEIKLPQNNIALFLEKTNNRLPAQATKRVASGRLKNLVKDKIIIPSPKEQEPIELFYADAPELNPSVENALIPIEKSSLPPLPEKVARSNIISPQKLDIEHKATEKKDKPKQPESLLAGLNISEEETKQPNQEIKDISETTFIPIENGEIALAKAKIEVADDAPKNQFAMVGNISLTTDDNAMKVLPKEEKQEKEWQSMEDSPWVVAKANKFAKNNQAVKDFSSSKTEEEISGLLEAEKLQEGEEIQTAQVAKNILIPIPDDILNDENLTPQLVSPKKKEKANSDNVEENKDPSQKGSFLKNITSIFSSSKNEETSKDVSTDEQITKTKPKKTTRPSVKILPAEMKLSFQPGRAQISGQTLRWIQAFALKATEEPDVILEIRIDKNSSYALQQRRLELLHTILGSKGIDDSKVSTVFTSREPNSFIIRTLRLSDEVQNNSATNSRNKQPVYQTW